MRKSITYIAAAVYILIIFRSLLLPGTLTAGDWGYRFRETALNASVGEVTWSTYFGNGLGGGKLILAPLDSWHILSSYVAERLGLSWPVAERIIWFFPLILIALFSGFVIARSVTRSFFLLGGGIFVVNTYFLLILSGGQMGVVWAAALLPLVLTLIQRFIDGVLSRKAPLSHIFIVSVTLAMQLVFDARIFYVTLLAGGIYAVFSMNRGNGPGALVRLACSTMSIALVVFGLHAFWLLPLLLYPSPIGVSLGTEYLSADALKFFSFADFSHAVSLLQPNWPENVFGKTGFLQPEFLLLPLIAFSSLLFVGSEKGDTRKKILYFALLGLTGVFLAKGVRQPFGGMYSWLFERVPGFIMFRDPTKFYSLTAVSYTVLIPYALSKYSNLLYPHIRHAKGFASKTTVQVLVIVCFIFFWSVLHRDMLLGNIGGTFAPHAVPREYVELKEYLVNDQTYARVLWVPARSRYGYYDDNKPALSLASVDVSSISAFPEWIDTEGSKEQLARFGVGYIVVPTDPHGELFVTDRTYDDAKRRETIRAIEQHGEYQRVAGFGGIQVFKTPSAYGHIYEPGDTSPIRIERVSPAEYVVDVAIYPQDRSVTFSERYDPYWRMEFDGVSLKPEKTADGLQKFEIPNGVGGTGKLRYLPQEVSRLGFFVSMVTGIVITVLWVFSGQFGRTSSIVTIPKRP